MKKDSASARLLALLAMLALFVAAYLADHLFALLRREASETFNVTPVMWANYGLGFLIALLAVLLVSLARGSLVHWAFLIVGLLVSFYIPLVMTGSLKMNAYAFSQVFPLLGANVILCARILAAGGLLGLLLKPKQDGPGD